MTDQRQSSSADTTFTPAALELAAELLKSNKPEIDETEESHSSSRYFPTLTINTEDVLTVNGTKQSIQGHVPAKLYLANTGILIGVYVFMQCAKSVAKPSHSRATKMVSGYQCRVQISVPGQRLEVGFWI
ncbi:hypothetical protein DFS34DRAFT_596274 [Phlyctochytrium arcticum]|nr:hypothetical protein DFS34DRAFT_596274 [Phlyctochytrium arcticum]